MVDTVEHFRNRSVRFYKSYNLALVETLNTKSRPRTSLHGQRSAIMMILIW